MKFTQGILYSLAILLIYLLLFIAELFLLTILIELFTLSFVVKLVVFIIFILLVNPIITFFIGEKLPFKVKGLKIVDGLQAELKKDVSFPSNSSNYDKIKS